MKIEIGLLGSHIARCVVFYWKIDDFGRVEVSRLAGAWLAGRVSKKCWNQKILLAKIGADTAENEQHFAEIFCPARPDRYRTGHLDPAVAASCEASCPFSEQLFFCRRADLAQVRHGEEPLRRVELARRRASEFPRTGSKPGIQTIPD